MAHQQARAPELPKSKTAARLASSILGALPFGSRPVYRLAE
jgi:hypothetical protein